MISKIKRIQWIGICVEAVNLGLIIWLLMHLSQFNVIPDGYRLGLLALFALSVIVPVLAVFLRRGRKLFYIIGAVLLVGSLTISILGIHYLGYGISILQKVTAVDSKTTTFGVYTRKDGDTISSYYIAAGQDGIYAREVIDSLQAEVIPAKSGSGSGSVTSPEPESSQESDTETSLTAKSGQDPELTQTTVTEEYAGLDSLMEAAYAQDDAALVLNTAYVDLIKDIPEYENFDEIYQLEAEYEIVEKLRKVTASAGVPDLEGEDGIDVQNSTRQGWDGREPFLLYISGIDVWGDITIVSRSDVNILMAVNPQTRQILLVNTPRDYYVPLSISGGVKDKLTHAGIYGIDVSRETMEMLYGIPIDYYFKLNFSGFEGMIDALGGITVWSDYDFTVEPIKHYEQGYNDLTGLEALAFARERHSFEEGDRQRGVDQMYVIQAVIDKLTSSAFLEHYTEIMDQVEGTFATDMTMDEIAAFARTQLADGGSWEILRLSADGTEDLQPTYSVGSDTYLFVMQPDEDSVAYVASMIHDVLQGQRIELPEVKTAPAP